MRYFKIVINFKTPTVLELDGFTLSNTAGTNLLANPISLKTDGGIANLTTDGNRATLTMIDGVFYPTTTFSASKTYEFIFDYGSEYAVGDLNALTVRTKQATGINDIELLCSLDNAPASTFVSYAKALLPVPSATTISGVVASSYSLVVSQIDAMINSILTTIKTSSRKYTDDQVAAKLGFALEAFDGDAATAGLQAWQRAQDTIADLQRDTNSATARLDAAFKTMSLTAKTIFA